MMWLKQGLRVPFCHTGNGQSSSVPHSSDMMLEGLELSNCPSIALDVWISQDMTSEPQNRHTLLNRNTKYSIRLFLLHSICTTTEDANQISLYLYNYGRKIKVFLFQDNRDCPRGFSPRSSSVSVQFQIHETLIGIFMRTSCLFLLGILLLCAIIQSNTYPTPHQNGNRNDFDRGTIVGARWACSNISETADLWGISHTGVCRVRAEVHWNENENGNWFELTGRLG